MPATFSPGHVVLPNRNLFPWFLSLVALLAGCSAHVSEPTSGVYRAVLELPGGAAPFGMEVAREGERTVLYLINGTERTRVDNVLDRRYAGSVIVNEGNARFYEPAPGRSYVLKLSGTYSF